MTLTAMRRSLLAMAGLVFVALFGSWLWLGETAVSEVRFPMLMALYLFVLLSEIVARVEARISELEEKLKRGAL